MLACARLPDGTVVVQELTEQGERVGDRRELGAAEPVAVPTGERWLWASTVQDYPPLIAAGVRASRCYDIAVVERILLGRAGSFGDPTSPVAVVARARGRPVPAVRPADVEAALTLFDLTDPAAGPEDADPIEALREAYLDQRRRAGTGTDTDTGTGTGTGTAPAATPTPTPAPTGRSGCCWPPNARPRWPRRRWAPSACPGGGRST